MINKYTALAQGEKKNHEQRPIKEQISEANPQKQRAKRLTLLGNMPPEKAEINKGQKSKDKLILPRTYIMKKGQKSKNNEENPKNQSKDRISPSKNRCELPKSRCALVKGQIQTPLFYVISM